MSYALLVPAPGAAYSAYAAQSMVIALPAQVPQAGYANPYAQPAQAPMAYAPSPIPGYFGMQAPGGFDPFAAAVSGTPFAGLAAPNYGYAPSFGYASSIAQSVIPSVAPSYNPIASFMPAQAVSPFGSIYGAPADPLTSLLGANPLSSLSAVPFSSPSAAAAAAPSSPFSSLFAPQAPVIPPAPAPNPMEAMMPMLMMMMMGGGGAGGDIGSLLPLMMMMGGGSTGSVTGGSANDPMASIMPLLLMKLLGGGLGDSLGGGSLSQVSDSPFGNLLPNNVLSQTATLPTWSSSSTTGTVAGDPHFTDITNTKGGTDYDVMGQAGKIYNILSDKNIQFNSQFIAWQGNGNATVNGTAAMRLKTDNGKEVQVKFDANGVPEVDGKKLAKGDKISFKMNGKDAFVEYTGDKMTVSTDEYIIEAQDKGTYLDYNVKTQKDGVLADRVNPHGLLGQTADGDTNIRAGKKGQGAQGEGAIDFKVNDYEVNDFFADPKAIINRFGIKTRAVADDKGKAIRLFDQQNNLIATADKDGNLVSVRRTVDAQGKVSLTLADGKTKIDESGKIIDAAPAEKK